MQVVYLDNCTEELVQCKPNELKVLLAMVKIAKNNVVDLGRKRRKLDELVGSSDKSIETAITGLRKRGILFKVGVPKVWFIDPSYFMKGYYKKIYAISEMIENKDKYLLEKLDDWEEEEKTDSEERRLQSRWENKRKLQEDFSAQVKVVDGMTDSNNRLINEEGKK